jgi:hypothetical protein
VVSSFSLNITSVLLGRKLSDTGNKLFLLQVQHPNYWQEEEMQVKRTQGRVPRKDLQKVSGKAAVTVNITRQRAVIGQ